MRDKRSKKKVGLGKGLIEQQAVGLDKKGLLWVSAVLKKQAQSPYGKCVTCFSSRISHSEMFSGCTYLMKF